MMKSKKENPYIKRIKFMVNTNGHSSKVMEFGFLSLALSELSKLFVNNLSLFKFNLFGSLICAFLMIYHFYSSCRIMIKNYIIQKKWKDKK